ncbi:MAG TPA: serine/threonine-protein kinase [Gemmataceae bacterium]|nr:serine/threonine-protein kinase [Gemmataceae bacterium]
MHQNEFLQAIVDSELLSESQLDDIRVRLIHLDDTAQIAGALQADGTLTTYQIKQLLAGCGKELVLGQYRLSAELGRGGFGRVYLARHVFMHRLVAIKVILPELVENERAKTWFRREMLAATQFDHPNIVTAYDANEVDGKLFLVVEYVDGQDLDKLVRDRGPMSEALALAVFRQAAAALEHANRKGMVHRDIKPGNMLVLASTLELMNDGSCRFETDLPLVKLTDFGLARLHQHRESHTLAGFRENGVVGTPEYISPEQARDIHSVDIRSDLYSLGCAWYYALTGRPPFRCATAMETVLKQIEEEPVPVESFRPDLSAVTRDIIKRLLAKQPSMRYQTPQELIDAIDFEGLEAPAAAPPPASDAANSRPILRPTPQTICIPELAFGHLRADEADPEPASVASVASVACAADSVSERQNESPNESFQVLAHPKGLSAESTAPRSAESVRAAAKAFERMRASWNEWLALVADVVDEHINIRATPEGYRVAYVDILEPSKADILPDDRLGIAKSVAAVVEPWFSLETLTSSNRDTLRDVLIHARRLNRTLFPQKDWSTLHKCALLLGAVTAAAVIGFVALRLKSEWVGIRSLGTLLETHRTLLLQASAVVVLPWLLVPTAKAVQRFTQNPSMSDANRR